MKTNNKPTTNNKLRFFKFAFMFSCLFIITSCEKELYDDAIKDAQRELKSEIVTGKNAENIISKLENSIKKKYKINGSGTNRITMDSIGTIKYDEIVKLTDEKGNSTYTFKVVRYDSSFSKFYNLVLQEKAEGNIVKLFEYTMTPEFAQQFSSTFNYKNFEGTLSTLTVINETPCPDNDILLVQVGQVLEGGNGSGGNYGDNGTSNTNTTTENNSGSSGTNSSSGTTGTGSSGTSSSSGSTGTTGGGGGQFYYEDFELFIECITNGGDWYIDSNGEAGCIADPRHFRMAINPEGNPNELDEDITIPCSPTYHVITLTPYTNCEKHFLQKTTTNKNWLAAHKNTEVYQQIMDYINGNGNNCSTEREDFMNECISQMDQNPGVFTSITPFLIEKQIDDSQLDSCTKGILDKLKSLQQNDIAKVIARFNNPNTAFSLNFSQASIPLQPNGDIRLGETSPPINNSCNITLNSTYFNNSGSTNLLKAQVVLHEIMHALIFSIVFNPQSSTNPDPTDFPAIWNAYVNHEFGDNNDNHHVFLGLNYVNIIGAALQEYDTGIPVPDGQTPSQLYTDIAWCGFIKIPQSTPTTPFDSILNSTDKVRLYGRLNAEKNRAYFNGTQPSSNNPCTN